MEFAAALQEASKEISIDRLKPKQLEAIK